MGDAAPRVLTDGLPENTQPHSTDRACELSNQRDWADCCDHSAAYCLTRVNRATAMPEHERAQQPRNISRRPAKRSTEAELGEKHHSSTQRQVMFHDARSRQAEHWHLEIDAGNCDSVLFHEPLSG